MAGKQQGPAAAPCPVVVPAPWCPPLRPPVPRGSWVGVPGDKQWEHMVYDLVPPPWGLSLESDGGTDKGTAGHSWQRKGTSSPDAPAGTVWRFPRRSCHTGSPPAPRPRSDPLAGFIFLFQRTAADPVPEALAGWGGRGERSARAASTSSTHQPGWLMVSRPARGLRLGWGRRGPARGAGGTPRAGDGERLWVGGHGLGDTVTKGPVSTESPPCQVGQSWGVTAGPQE